MRLLLTCGRPCGGWDEGLAWLRAQAAEVAGDPAVGAIAVSEVAPVWPAVPLAGVLIEFELAQSSDPQEVARREPLAGLVLELQSLGLKPQLGVAAEAPTIGTRHSG